MLSVDVKKQQGEFRLELAFEAEKNRVTALFGPSGSGKTTLINMIAGLVSPDTGSIYLDGRPLYDSEGKIHVAVEKRRIGYVFQEARLFPHMNVRSNLIYGMKRLRREARRISFDHVVSLLGIGHLIERGTATLSGGEKQRVAIGRALLTSPSLLMMDEPLASLDQQRKEDVLPFIADVARDLAIPIVYVSHSMDEISALTDRVVFIRQGRIGLDPSWERSPSCADKRVTPVSPLGEGSPCVA